MRTIETNTLMFQFICIDFYKTIADMREMLDFIPDEIYDKIEFEEYRNMFVPEVQEWAKEVSDKIPGIHEIRVNEIESPSEYNFSTDYAVVEVDVCNDYKTVFKKNRKAILSNKDCIDWWNKNCKERSGYIPFENRKLSEFMDDFGNNEDNRSISISLTLMYINFVGKNEYEKWIEIEYGVYFKRESFFSDLIERAKKKTEKNEK